MRTQGDHDSCVTVLSFGSGSSGNAFLVHSSHGAILVDCGIGIRALRSGFATLGLSPDQLDAILVTHEHVDHVRALPQVLRSGRPVAATRGTLAAAGVPASSRTEVVPGKASSLGRFTVTALAVSHDAAEPCGFHLEVDGVRVLIVTDLGRSDDALRESIQSADLVVLEANHDEAMLRNGPYPAHLKRRVLSHHGHLSNADCGLLLRSSLAGRQPPSSIWLAHLSETNNRPDLARRTVEHHLQAAGVETEVLPLPRHGVARWSSGELVRPARQLSLLLS